MTLSEAGLLLRELREVFDIVRFVDVAMTTQYTMDEEGRLCEGEYKCYAVWKKGERCENCISANAFARKARLSKYEFVDDKVYHVVSKYVEIDGVPYVLEIVANVTDSLLYGASGKEKIVSAIAANNKKLYRDTLTGAFDREYFDRQLCALLPTSAVVILDIDDFRRVNDTLGDSAGDRVLQAVAQTIKGTMRANDAVVRYGGDEFVLILRKMKRDLLRVRLASLREKIAGIRLPEYPQLRVAVSMGGCAADDDAPDRMLAADRRLCRAKERGNTVVTE